MAYTQKQIKEMIDAKLSHNFGLAPEDADEEHIYKALALSLRDIMSQKRRKFSADYRKKGGKRVYYLSMEYLMGRSLKNSLFNLGLEKTAAAIMPKYGTTLDRIYNLEPDAGLGNGGLGRLAACFLDAFAADGILATGYTLRYEFGIFNQKLVDGWQTELPDFWLPGGEAWLVRHSEDTMDVKFGGWVEETWNEGYHSARHQGASIIKAVPYDMMVAGPKGDAVSCLRLWAAECPEIDMGSINSGQYMRAIEQKAMAEMLTKVLYPEDNHYEGKSLRLSQQYFLVSASMQDIIKRQLRQNGTLDNLADAMAIHINDTHPTLIIPEMMRILMDECGFGWDSAWEAVTKTTAYTNHTVMKEALECWSIELFKAKLPRIYQIVCEINRRFCDEMTEKTGHDYAKVGCMSIIKDGIVKMANLCVCACHSVNGVSELHSEIIKKDPELFNDFYTMMPEKFTNVTNGIAHRRWLCQANPRLSSLISELIGDGYILDAGKLSELEKFKNDGSVLERLAQIKRDNKADFAAVVKKQSGIALDPDSVFDVQIKRLHEYKRQHLNALHIISQYRWLLDNPNADFQPKTYIFGAKAAPGYYFAKEIIKLLYFLQQQINSDKRVKDKLKVVFYENYRVTVAEQLIPAAEISEQISLAGKEASGTGNMKFMLNGALTLGTEDGANVEIHRAVGDGSIIIFGLRSDEVECMKKDYHPSRYYNNNAQLRASIDMLKTGFGGVSFDNIAQNLLSLDPYMVLADYEDYVRAQAFAAQLYESKAAWNRASLVNIANSGIFAADRSIADYAEKVWGIK